MLLFRKKDKAALRILTAAREHVAEYGPTGGNPRYMAAPVCPRGLVAYFANEGHRDIFSEPKKAGAKMALQALDDVAVEALVVSADRVIAVSGPGQFAEHHCWELSVKADDKRLGAEYFQRAIERVSNVA